MDLRDYSSIVDKRKALERELNISLFSIGSSTLDTSVAEKRNCENMIGFTQVPIGVAGVLRIKDKGLRIKDYYVPLATTEGALVASINRGCKVITQSGGADVIVEKIGMTRAPVFQVKNIRHGYEFMRQVDQHLEQFKKIAERTSSHLTLLSTKSWMIGKNVFVRFTYDTQEAMGMNMVTFATSNITSYIEEKIGVKCISLSGNMCVDKKANYLNFIEGRGFRAWADIVVPEKFVRETLKITSEKIMEVWNRKVVHGSIMSGTIGANAHAANTIAAIFLATGQDLAHVVEASSVVTSLEKEQDELYVSIYLPDLPVGIIGGGTMLPTQKEALNMLNIHSPDEFAGVIAAATLAGELSLLASLAEGTLAKAHNHLARGKLV